MDPHANNNADNNDNDDDVDTTGGWIIVRSEFLIPSRTKSQNLQYMYLLPTSYPPVFLTYDKSFRIIGRC